MSKGWNRMVRDCMIIVIMRRGHCKDARNGAKADADADAPANIASGQKCLQVAAASEQRPKTTGKSCSGCVVKKATGDNNSGGG